MSCNTKLIHIQIIFMHFCVLTSGPLQPVRMWHVLLCALIVIGPEFKTQNRCRHL